VKKLILATGKERGIDAMDNTRNARQYETKKSKNTEHGKKMYRKLNNALRMETEKAKEKWWETECRELEELNNRGRSELVYAKEKNLTT
jgi:hypothetical protein